MPRHLSIRAMRENLAARLQPTPISPPDQEIQDNAANILARDRQRQEEERRLQVEAERKAQQQRDYEIQQQRIREANEAAERRRVELQLQEQKDIENARKQQQVMQKRNNASTQSVARLRYLLRERYRLDVWIWSQRECSRADRHIIMEDCSKADNILQQIYGIVHEWDQELFQNAEYPEEWRIAKTIKDTIMMRKDQHVIWCKTPPWEFLEDGSPIARRPVPGHR